MIVHPFQKLHLIISLVYTWLALRSAVVECFVTFPSHTVKRPGVDLRPTTQLLYSTGVMNETQTFGPPPHSQSHVSSPSSLLRESKIDAEGGKVLQFMEFYAENGLGWNTARHDVDRNGSNRCVEINGNQVLFFGSGSYLGLESHPHLIEGARSAAKKYGTQFPSSRAYVSTELYNRLEALLGSIYSRPVLVTPNTMLAHIAALPTLVGDDDAVVLDVQVHATVQTAAQLLKARGVPLRLVPHNDMDSLEKTIERLRNKHEKVWYLADGLYSMHGDEAPFRKVKEFLDKYDNFHFYVDDAHGVGWAGENGSGVARRHMEHHERMVMAISLNKSFGAGGGALVFANEHQKQLVLKCGGPMIFSGPIQPPMLGAACASAEFHLSPELKIRQTMLQRLIARCNYMIDRYNLPQLERNGSPIFFIAVGRVEMTAEIIKRMMNDGYFLNIAGYPAVPKNRSGLRFMMNAHLRSDDVDNFLGLIRKHYKNVLTETGVKEIDVAKNFDIPPFKL